MLPDHNPYFMFKHLSHPGEMHGARSERVSRLHELVQGAGFDARISESIALEMWQKWTSLATLGGVTCLMRGNTGEIEAAHGGREFLTKFLNEVVWVVQTVGTPLGEAFIAATTEALLKPGAPTTSSLYQDLQEGKPVEADQIRGDLLVRGAEAGLRAPLISCAYAHADTHGRARTARKVAPKLPPKLLRVP